MDDTTDNHDTDADRTLRADPTVDATDAAAALGDETVGEIQIIETEDGVALIGDPAIVDHFLTTQDLDSKPMDMQRMGTVVASAGAVTQAAAGIAEQSGRWVKLTEKSAQALKTGTLMTGSAPGVKRAMLVTGGNKIKGHLEIIQAPATLLSNPAVLMNLGALMSQMAMQQQMDEIEDYLATINEKVDDILRAQKDAVLAELIGVGLVIDEAIVVRKHTGRVSATTWSKVDDSHQVIAQMQAFALRRLDALAEKLESRSKLADVVKEANAVESAVREWLAVIARCFQLYDGVAVLELDYVMDTDPESVDQLRSALSAARQSRRDMIGRSTGRLLDRIDLVADEANKKALLRPFAAKAVVESVNRTGEGIVAFHNHLDIDEDRLAVTSVRWRDAVGKTRDQVVGAGVGGVRAAKRFGAETRDRADRASLDLAAKALRRRGFEVTEAGGDTAAEIEKPQAERKPIDG